MTRAATLVATMAMAALAAVGFGAAAGAADSAVVMLYHRFGEDQFPTTSIGLDQFESHIAELKSGGYTVLPVPEIVAALRDGRPLPDLAVGITVDDAYESIVTQAWPRLKAAGFPLTVFVATGPIDKGFRDYMTWDQIRALAKDGVTIGAHSASHLHMADASAETNADEIARSNKRFAEELGFVPGLFAYPYGEASLAVRRQVQDSGYKFAFGQHSGVIYRGSDFFDLPRFALNEHYGDIAKFRERARALPLPLQDFTPADPLVAGNNPPAIGFTLDPAIRDGEKLACYGSERDGLTMRRLEGNRFEVKLASPLPPGRFRLSCTIPAGNGRFRWFGAPFYVPAR
ncbi:MAG TPA: polysaccharide deacetylase family protein [Alphaproteobacteria bacterium]|nr:polysaccharide deacetylase family protein [Alphaproteobacteria bacterium]